VDKPTIILATSNGIGMGHLARACAIAEELKAVANPILVSVAGGIADVPSTMGIRCEYIPGKTRRWMPAHRWDAYLRDRLVALVQETDASVISFDGVVPYPGFIATKLKWPSLSIVWVRRGLWQKNILRFALPLQSRLMDQIIEPGDIARSYDRGPTSQRTDARLTSPVSLFKKGTALSRSDARALLNLDPNRPAVLVQLGAGDADMNEKMTAALKGLIGWDQLQVVLTKDPVNSEGVSLVPTGLDVRVIRHFPLARVLAAFDGALAATGYNSVHELLPAQIPTVFISNIRGTDDQDARAKWCHNFGYALRADHSDLDHITETVALLQREDVRSALVSKCVELSNTNGGSEIAQILLALASGNSKKSNIGGTIFRWVAVSGIHWATYVYRLLRPHKLTTTPDHSETLFSSETDAQFLRDSIKGNHRFEHLVADASTEYLVRRKEIAAKAYGK